MYPKNQSPVLFRPVKCRGGNSEKRQRIPAGTRPPFRNRQARLKAVEGKAIYKKREEMVESVFGIIKQVMGFRQFLLRGLEMMNMEWEIVYLGYNIKRLFICKPPFSARVTIIPTPFVRLVRIWAVPRTSKADEMLKRVGECSLI